jgi:uncharacterized coiled-coil protein SlyX
MQYRGSTKTRSIALVTALILAGAAACGPKEEVERQLAQLEAVSAEKDSLLAQVTENSLLLSQIGVELANAQGPAAQEGREVSYSDPDVMLESIRDMSSRLDDSETRLAESRRRVETLSKDLDGRNSTIAAFEKTVTDLQTAIDNQRQTIVSLTEQLESLQRENVQLVTHNEDLTRTVDDMTVRENSAWYIVGTKDELLEKGIVTEKGGSRVLFIFGKRGKTLVPARNIDVSQFNRIDVTLDGDIPLPDPDREYSIVSLQDLSALGNLPDDDQRYTGEALHIVDPDRFWANYRVLVVVQES